MIAPSFRTRFALALALSSLACASGAGGTSSSSVARRALVADRLYFGRDIPNGGEVADAEWIGFVDSVITPRFPGGLTIWRADGQWRDSLGAIEHETVMVLEVLHPPDAAIDAALEAIAREYKRRFRQEAVMRTTTPADARFYD